MWPLLTLFALLVFSLAPDLAHSQTEGNEVTILSGDVVVTATVTEAAPGALYEAKNLSAP